MENKNNVINLNNCKKGDKLLSSQGSILEYVTKTPWRNYTYLDHVVRYVKDKNGKLYSKNNYGTRTDDGYVFLNKREHETDNDIVEIIGKI